jgi:hypothetical protein
MMSIADRRPEAAPGVIAPALAGLAVTAALEGRPGVRTFLRSRIRWRVAGVVGLTYLATFVVILFVGGGQEDLPLFLLIPNYDNAGYGAAEVAAAYVVLLLAFGVVIAVATRGRLGCAEPGAVIPDQNHD